MPAFYTAAALVASASLSYAAPAAFGQSSGAFTVNQVPAGRIHRHGATDMLKTYNKFAHVGAVAPDVVVAAAATGGQQGTAAADPETNDQAYLVEVTLGQSKVNLDFDTGSADLWCFASNTPSQYVGSHATYDVSTGTIEQGESWEISYGDGSGASGDNVYADTVVVGSVTATSQAIEAATSVSSEFMQDPSDGLLGLAFSSINTAKPKQVTTFFDTVLSSLNSAVFTANLVSSGPGSYTFGFVDSSLYSGSITYVPVDNSQGFWQFTAGGYSGSGSNSSTGNIGTAIADTGTSLMYIPDAAVTSYYSGVSGASNSKSAGGWIFPCDTTLPDFTVSIGGAQFTIAGSTINYAQQDGSCFGGIQSDAGIGFSIFGDVFLRNVYAVFDMTQSSPRLGFAAKA